MERERATEGTWDHTKKLAQQWEGEGRNHWGTKHRAKRIYKSAVGKGCFGGVPSSTDFTEHQDVCSRWGPGY